MVGKGCFYTDIAIEAAAAGDAGILSLANPEGRDLIITRFIIHTTTAATGATTIDAGIDADGTGSADTLLDGVTINAVGIRDNITDQAGNGLQATTWADDQFITITKTVGGALSEVDLVARVSVEYIRA